MPSESESFLGIPPRPSDTPSAPDGVGLGARFFVLATTWFTALFVTHPDLRGIPAIYLFPFGLPLLRFLPDKSDATLAALVGGWLFYGALSAAVLFSTKKAWFFIFYAVLTALLITNVAGCREILNNNSKTH